MNEHVVDAEELVAVIWRRRWLILGSVIACATLAAAYALTRQPMYESDALLAPVQDPSSQLGSVGGLLGRFAGLGDALGIAAGPTSSAEEATALIASRQFTDEFLRQNGVLPYLFPERWDTGRQAWRPARDGGKNPPQDATGVPHRTVDEPSPEIAAERFAKWRDVVIDRRTGFVRLAVRGPTPALAHDWAEALIREANARLRDKALAEVRASLALLTERMDSLQFASVRAAAAALLESYMRREVVLMAKPDYALSVIDPPTTPERRYYPHRTHMVAIGAMLGLVAAALIVLAGNVWRGLRAALRR